jgi:hypothetical protein
VDKTKYLGKPKYNGVVTNYDNVLFHILTMGHRIHVIVGDPTSQKVELKFYSYEPFILTSYVDFGYSIYQLERSQ